jgi:hypothetical protein
MFRAKVVEEIKTHIMCSVTFSKFVPFMISEKNMVEPEKPHMTIWCMRIEYWMPAATITHTHNTHGAYKLSEDFVTP